MHWNLGLKFKKTNNREKALLVNNILHQIIFQRETSGPIYLDIYESYNLIAVRHQVKQI